MRFSAILLASAAWLPATGAWPHMKAQLDQLPHLLMARQADTDNDVNTEMIGDLRTGATTAVGKSIQNILLKKESAQSKTTYVPNPLALPGTSMCKQDTCCIWYHVSNTLTTAFTGLISVDGLPTMNCNDDARAAIRLAFHDSGTWSKSLAAQGKDFGGADGSIVLAPSEILRTENNGLQNIAKKMTGWAKQFGVPMGDLIQFAAAHAVVTCPLGPRMRVFVGRKDSSGAAPDGLLPDVRASADSLIDLFQDKTISPHELTALLGAHSNSKQRFFDPSRAGAAQDSSPGTWDILYYNQTQEPVASANIVRFPSDLALAQHPKMSDEWTKFREPNGKGQSHWNEDYSAAYTRLSLLGVNNINSLTECSKVLPPAKPLGIAITQPASTSTARATAAAATSTKR